MTANVNSIITRMSHSEALMRLEPVVLAFTTGTPIPGPWPEFMDQPHQVKATYDAFKELHKAAEAGTFAMVAQRNALRPEFNRTFIDLADYVALAAKKDPTVPVKTGFDYFWRTKTRTAAASRKELTAPRLTLENAEERGVLYGKATGASKARSFEVQFTYGDPTVEANWSHFGTYGAGSKMIMRGLESGRLASFRVRAVGNNEWGPWSHHISLTVT